MLTEQQGPSSQVHSRMAYAEVHRHKISEHRGQGTGPRSFPGGKGPVSYKGWQTTTSDISMVASEVGR